MLKRGLTEQYWGWFHLKLGVSADDKIERVFLCDSPIDALSMAEIDIQGHLGQPPVRTMYMAVGNYRVICQRDAVCFASY
ncbi:MAG: hypothetical protein ACYT04_83380 [Nostoc sp.]